MGAPLAPAAAYVDALFASAGVTPTAAERNAAINAFGAGGTGGRVAALRSVTDSVSLRAAEARVSFVLAEYFGYLRRNPTDAPDFSDAQVKQELGEAYSLYLAVTQMTRLCLTGVFERHDRTRFETVAISFKSDTHN